VQVTVRLLRSRLEALEARYPGTTRAEAIRRAVDEAIRRADA